MEDFSHFTVIPENLEYEKVLTKNHSYKTENKNLKNLLFIIGICFLGACVYLVNEELNKKTRSI
jgi:hypothetical protein